MTWYILNVPAVSCKWATQGNCMYFLWEISGCSNQLPNGDITVTWLGTLWVYWLCPGLGHCREIGLENSERTCSVPGRYMVGTLSISLQCTCSVPVQYTTPCPQCKQDVSTAVSTRERIDFGPLSVATLSVDDDHPRQRTCLRPKPKASIASGPPPHIPLLSSVWYILYTTWIL